IVECVPNFSEGRDRKVIGALEQAVRSVNGVHLLNSTSDADHNRSVLTFAGDPAAVANAAFVSVAAAVANIDLAKHEGVHPRVGAADVVPFVPIESVTLEDCATLAHTTGERIWKELGVPVFFYEAAAKRPECARLENIRRRASADLPPDIGEGRHPTAGYCVVGARNFLIAWNIVLHSNDLAIAKSIANEIREAGGGLPAVKALGLELASQGKVQVSMNLVDFRRTPMHVVFEAVRRGAKKRGVEIEGSELIGLIPQAALDASKGYDFRWINMRSDLILETCLSGSR
ncbi:MAG TPA: glutamate formimidoyltransferase, partial [Bryobacteraceae bacterium]|nr:glutamate formimidoyltransferase [Bryobacteraceae bacterium]